VFQRLMKMSFEQRRKFITQFLRVLEHNGAMTEKLLRFHMEILGFNPNSVPRIRRELEKKCMIQNKKVWVRNGRCVRLWERTR
jgi:hypothetical protein